MAAPKKWTQIGHVEIINPHGEYLTLGGNNNKDIHWVKNKRNNRYKWTMFKLSNGGNVHQFRNLSKSQMQNPGSGLYMNSHYNKKDKKTYTKCTGTKDDGESMYHIRLEDKQKKWYNTKCQIENTTYESFIYDHEDSSGPAWLTIQPV
eukprot:461702_1